ncbi:MAG: hypothetical protein KGI50_00360 [Patescibacteria group bacterium]|nr:hypothetical protein [Patescibacteria group bacterium]
MKQIKKKKVAKNVVKKVSAAKKPAKKGTVKLVKEPLKTKSEKRAMKKHQKREIGVIKKLALKGKTTKRPVSKKVKSHLVAKKSIKNPLPTKRVVIVSSVHEKEVGVVTHMFDAIRVGVVLLAKAGLQKGDHIRIRRGDVVFDQRVESMQKDHVHLDAAKKGEEIGLKLKKVTKSGAKVYKIEK